MQMSNSSLVTYTKISPNKTTSRKDPISRITIHCVVGQCTVESLGEVFAPTSRKASSNYGVGKDGRIGMYVEECDASWCSSSSNNDQKSITIECASDTTPPYAVTSAAYAALLDLCTEICERNGKKKLLWLGDKAKTLAYTPADDEMVLTIHRWFASTACPGEYLYSRQGEIAEEVTRRLTGESAQQPESKPQTGKTFYRVVAGSFEKKENAEAQLAKLKAAGITGGFIAAYTNEEATQEVTPSEPKKTVDELAREVLQGKWGNGKERETKLQAAGYDYKAVQNRVNELLK